MAAVEAMAEGAVKVKRFSTCQDGYYYSNGYCYPSSSWYWWGRWVFAGVVVVVVIAILLLLGCVNARRRRRRGMAPMYGTGWMGGNKAYGGANAYNAQPGAYQYGPPPPQYSQQAPVPEQYTGTTFSPNDGYYGQQHDGIQLQQPANTYTRAGEHGYEPPPGPPPNKIA